MGYSYRKYIRSESGAFGCVKCKTHLAALEHLESHAFQGQTGRALLFSNVVNYVLSKAEDRGMTTGVHTVADLQCRRCNLQLGWKYIFAYDESQKYKEGKYILEKARITKVDGGLSNRRMELYSRNGMTYSDEEQDSDDE
ncbi:yippee-domain-containing protein, partial [Wallemia mellicola CBS 633.66]|uniref:Protein yippee-like n=2 Tax=Wallemia mellicola TaxID=1708541 RepID=A0A4T0TKE3_9BASI